jgi:hypothetical protein
MNMSVVVKRHDHSIQWLKYGPKRERVILIANENFKWCSCSSAINDGVVVYVFCLVWVPSCLFYFHYWPRNLLRNNIRANRRLDVHINNINTYVNYSKKVKEHPVQKAQFRSSYHRLVLHWYSQGFNISLAKNPLWQKCWGSRKR